MWVCPCSARQGHTSGAHGSSRRHPALRRAARSALRDPAFLMTAFLRPYLYAATHGELYRLKYDTPGAAWEVVIGVFGREGTWPGKWFSGLFSTGSALFVELCGDNTYCLVELDARPVTLRPLPELVDPVFGERNIYSRKPVHARGDDMEIETCDGATGELIETLVVSPSRNELRVLLPPGAEGPASRPARLPADMRLDNYPVIGDGVITFWPSPQDARPGPLAYRADDRSVRIAPQDRWYVGAAPAARRPVLRQRAARDQIAAPGGGCVDRVARRRDGAGVQAVLWLRRVQGAHDAAQGRQRVLPQRRMHGRGRGVLYRLGRDWRRNAPLRPGFLRPRTSSAGRAARTR